MAARRHREQPYLSLNPYGRVPTLEDDGFVLFESTAILNYLETTCDLQFARQAGTIVFPKRFLPKERWNNAAMAEARAEIEKHLAILEKHLAGRNYLVAEQFSLADLCYAPYFCL